MIKVIAQARAIVFIPITILCSLLIASGIYYEINDNGLRGTILFNSLWYFSYAIFYGGMLYALYESTIILKKRYSYIYVDRGCLFIAGRRPIPLESISKIEIARYLILFKKIRIISRNGRYIEVKGYAINKSSEQLCAEISEFLIQ